MWKLYTCIIFLPVIVLTLFNYPYYIYYLSKNLKSLEVFDTQVSSNYTFIDRLID